jgi:hypothetical protein
LRCSAVAAELGTAATMRSRSAAETVTSPEMAKQTPLGAWETGDCRTTSAGDRVIGGAACDMTAIL